MEKRAVITGLGVISPVGNGKDTFWNALITGQNGIAPITHFDTTEYSARIAGEVKNFDPADYGIDRKEARHMDISTQYAVAAAKLALDDSGINLEQENRDRIGTMVGTGIGGMETLHNLYKGLFEKGPSRVNPFVVPKMIANMAAGQVSIVFGLHGHCASIATACATGTNSIGDAYRMIQRGELDAVVAGGTEATVSPGAVAGFAAMKALSTRNDDPEHASRPFDKERDGFVMGEGAGIVILEELEHAIKRGAHIYCEIGGYGSNADAYHITAPAPEGVYQAKCMQLAVDDAGIKPEEVNYVNAHGTSTHLNDLNESLAIAKVFGEHAKDMFVSSTKSMTGHLLGAAGAIEAIACAMTIEQGKVHPTINCDEPEDELKVLGLNYVQGNKAIDANIDVAISNSFGFGGHNATLLFKKYSEN
ncbi:beta-ketoacyl-ACP synthase II [Megasphaera paucivorans]|uniref:3-oxoacyl-[acyl-carrier-protein] synthase 2 n=1 Tax=Megasphaera paucivorans TaxID=349095 RepID=A0A1G9TNI4_9FIRM|nr:beta-ketoacyl-ACP synthase II [Megasphaera paucivorans]SDM49098.1 3-oxoacyl-[acyl-carrier-protein] synthase II [Megasphaera paucivorans]